jgi:hypothetical protein
VTRPTRRASTRSQHLGLSSAAGRDDAAPPG